VRLFDICVHMKVVFTFVVLFFLSSLFSQNYTFKNKGQLMFYDYQASKFCIIEDSTHRILIDLSTNRMEKRPLHLDSQIHFTDLLSYYKVLTEKGADVYFVDKGCGYVLLLRNDSIVRIDKSFHHQNQYNASYFLYKNAPHVFGGYGFFNFKDYMLKYDHNLCQWFMQTRLTNYSCSDRNPYMVCKNKYYCVSGKIVTDGESNYFFENLISYNFSTQKWKNLGEIDPSAFPKKEKIEIAHKNLLVSLHKLYLYDFQKNEVEIFDLKNIPSLKDVYIENGRVIMKRSITRVVQYETLISSMPLGVFKSKYLISKKAIIAPDPNFKLLLLMSLLILGTLLVVFFEYRRRRSGKVKRIQTNGKISKSTQKLLTLWLTKDDLSLEYSQLNDLVNEDSPSVDAIKKRRENLLDLFKYQISLKCNLAPNDVFTTTQHVNDKRMKVIILNPVVKIMVDKGEFS
jgi:hypothetical protein